MKRHILGLAIFSLIVAAAAMISSLFVVPVNPPNIIVNENNYDSVAKNSCQRMKRNFSKAQRQITYRIENISVSDENVLTAKIQFYWNGIVPPDALNYDVNLFSSDQPSNVIKVDSGMIQNPFSEGRTLTKVLTTRIEKGTSKTLSRENYYAYLDVSSIQLNKSITSNPEQKLGVVTRILLNDNEKLAEAEPVTIAHKK